MTRREAIAIADDYTRVKWTPEERHVRHGVDRSGVLVHTPDQSLNRRGFANGWWLPGREKIDFQRVAIPCAGDADQVSEARGLLHLGLATQLIEGVDHRYGEGQLLG